MGFFKKGGLKGVTKKRAIESIGVSKKEGA